MITPNYLPARMETTGNKPVCDVTQSVASTTEELVFGRVLRPGRFAAEGLFVNHGRILESAQDYATSLGWDYKALLAQAAERSTHLQCFGAEKAPSPEDIQRILAEDDAFFGF
jgi:hypothetical protein